MQKDLKRLVAYSSVAHLGFIVLGTFAFTTQSITGGVLQMINHGVSTGALFLLVGMIYERRHTREIAELRGIQQVAPIFAAGFMVVMLSSIGVPGLNGFVGEYLDPHRLVPDRPLVDGRRRRRRDPRRPVPAVGLPAGVPRRARRGQPARSPSSRCKEGLVLLPFIGIDRVHRRLPEADARPHRAERRRASSTTSRSAPARSTEPTSSVGARRSRSSEDGRGMTT